VFWEGSALGVLIYDTGILYDQHMDEDAQKRFENFYRAIFAPYQIKTIHDCSIGAGGTTLPLARMGYNVSGSDLNENLLNKARENFAKYGFSPNCFARTSDSSVIDSNRALIA
jgi:2-polyprenyl-3-methyl-5-hydroxy-6-metoxy-1,4-benzoquinol methylase